jgi:hypothetical protein
MQVCRYLENIDFKGCAICYAGAEYNNHSAPVGALKTFGRTLVL